MKSESKGKHLTLTDRAIIEECLAKNKCFKEIAEQLGKHPTTISREVKNHAHSHKNSYSVEDGICPQLLKAPFVCNGCSKRSRSSCPYARLIYVAKRAQSEYESLLSEAREGIALNKASMIPTRLSQLP